MEFALVVGAELSGAPTAISHRWPGCPWAGFFPETADAVLATSLGFGGAEFNGAPTAMSHLWPGLPCSGFNGPASLLPDG